MYVIKRLDQGGGWEADPSRNPTGGSYTRRLQYARWYTSYEHAKLNCCGNEVPQSIAEVMPAAYSR